jgi:Protein of unknown function (DUF3370)
MFSVLGSTLIAPGLLAMLAVPTVMAAERPQPTASPPRAGDYSSQLARYEEPPRLRPRPPTTPAVTPPAVIAPAVIAPAVVPPAANPPAAAPGAPIAPIVPPSQATGLISNDAVRPLLGRLDDIPVFNSNSPEMVRTEGILLSTFPPDGKRFPQAHLSYPLKGRFDVFAHHITQLDRPGSVTTLYLGILLFNPNAETVIVTLPQAATYLSTPDAPFRRLPSIIDNPTGFVFSGPGSRVMNYVLRGRRQTQFPSMIMIPPGESRMLASLPIPLPRRSNGRFLAPQLQPIPDLTGANPLYPMIEDVPVEGQHEPSSNGRSTLAYLNSTGPLYMASMAMYSRVGQDGVERAPSLQDWQNMVVNGNLVSPRDKVPSPMELVNNTANRFLYGRVAGVSRGSQWQARLTDPYGGDRLTIPAPGRSISYGISTLHRGTLGTGQVQSAPMIVRYPDTAYFAHGNYGVRYNLTLPLFNPSNQRQAVAVKLQTPLKEENPYLNFLQSPAPQVFFRGTVRVNYNGDDGILYSRFVHLVQRRGQRGEPIVLLNLQPGEARNVEVEFLYPPDATPPQVLTIATQVASNLLTTRNP